MPTSNLVILNSLESLKEFTADTIIDVRAPAEYADDHLPGAINLLNEPNY